MTTARRTVALTAAALLLGALPPAALGALSSAAYRVGRLCAAPEPGHVACLGLRLSARRPFTLRGSRRVSPAAAQAAPGGTGTTAERGPAPGSAARPALEREEFVEPPAGSLSPQNLQSAYGLAGAPAPAAQQTLALVDAYDDPTVEQDLTVFDERYGLAACTAANGCFTKVKVRSPPVEPGWAQEIATDVETAHGICPGCRILLVEAHSNENADLEEAERRALQLGAGEISNSWGGPELGVSVLEDETDAFNHPGTVITAAAGDNGYLDWGAEKASERGYADYPASSPHVIAVGGTRLTLTAGGAWREETVWNGSGAGGGGCSKVLAAPSWQRSLANWSAVGCGTHRAVSDVAADADPYTGVAVYDSTWVREGEFEYRGWAPIGGTSVASPIVAATFALAGGAGTSAGGQTVEYPARTLYENLAANPVALHDVTAGSNGACAKGFNGATGASNCSGAEEAAQCSSTAICLAGPGYDGPTGVGTPNGLAAFRSPGEAARIKRLEEEQKAAEERKAEEEKLAREKAEAEKRAKEKAEAERKAEEERLAKEKAETERKAQEAKLARERAEAEHRAEEEQRLAEEAQALKAREEALAAEALARAEQTVGGQTSQASLGAGAGAGAGEVLDAALQPPGIAAPAPVLSAPALTRAATQALARFHRPGVRRIAFGFRLSAPAGVRVSLAKQLPAVLPGGARWQTLPYSLTLRGVRGPNSGHLQARAVLAPGRYRLTLAPLGGTARAIVFRVR